MRHNIIAVVFIFSLIASYGFNKNKSAIALEEVTKQFSTGMEIVMENIEELKVSAIDLSDDPAQIISLQEAITNTRLAYKKIEFLLAYFDDYSIKKNINGAPLPTLEPNVPEVMPIEPSGLQVLDELIFSDNLMEQKQEIIDLTQKLSKDFQALIKYQRRIKITHRHVLESIRQGLIRVYTLGVTGFDTPGSANAIPETHATLSGIYGALNAYMSLITEESRGFAILMDARMDHTLDFLTKHNDFDNFDRLKFLKEHIDPQYEIIYSIHKRLGVEFIEETTDFPQAVNYHAKSLFAKDFLNWGYYANLDIKDSLIDARKELGRILFFDPVLSNTNDLACATCHAPEKAFTDGKRKSVSTKNTILNRNAPSLVNVVYSDKYFWDFKEHRLDKQMMHVVKNHKEFDTDFVKIIDKLKESGHYKELFKKAYPAYEAYEISTHSISDALTVYVASLTDFDSPFDQYVSGKSANIDPAAYRGYNLFMGKAACGTCHFAPTFNGTVPPRYTESETEVLGVPSTKDTVNVVLDPDVGRYHNRLPTDEAEFYQHAFKTVTVRNVELTAPYMHNGVYDSLEEVVDFYNRGGGTGMGISLPNQTLPFSELNLSDAEQADLVAFMKSLTGDMTKFTQPDSLPIFENNAELNKRSIGGNY